MKTRCFWLLNILLSLLFVALSCGEQELAQLAELNKNESLVKEVKAAVNTIDGFTFTDIEETSLVVSWQDLTELIPGLKDVSYQLYYTSTQPEDDIAITLEMVNTSWTKVGSAKTNELTQKVEMLDPGTTYYFTVMVLYETKQHVFYPVASQSTASSLDTSNREPKQDSSSAVASEKPTVSLGNPSKKLISSSTSTTIALSYKLTSNVTRVVGLTADGTGVTLSKVSGDTPDCTIEVSSANSTEPLVTISDCSGNGVFTVHIDEGALKDSTGALSPQSAESEEITVDNTEPTMVQMTPATSDVNPMPTTVVASFSEAVNPLAKSAFTISGTCNPLPTISTVTMSEDAKVATATLVGGTCNHGATLTVGVDYHAVSDIAGNELATSELANTYTRNTQGPSAALAAPSQSRLRLSTSATIALTYTGATELNGTLTSSGGGVTLTTISGSPSCTAGVSSMSNSGATITLSSCSGNGSLTVRVNAGTAKNAIGNLSTASSESSLITIDNTAPTVSSTSPSNGSNFSTVPSSMTVTFSEIVTASSSNFTLTSTTCTAPTISSISGSGTNIITLNLSGGSCGAGQVLKINVVGSGITDLAGNTGASTSVITLNYLVTKYIFVTTGTAGNGTFTGNLSGISGADASCNADSNKPNSSTYKALIVDGTNRVACTSANCATSGNSEHVDWVLAASTQYKRPNGTVIGTTNSLKLFTFNLTNAISPMISNSYAWTGFSSSRDWTTSASTCSSWSSTSGNGEAGRLASTDAQSMQYFTPTCSSSRFLYCVEQ